jgi:hypothetical protein
MRACFARRRNGSLTRTELLASGDDLTAATANRVFGEFGFKPMADILSELVAEVRRGS